MSQKTVILVTGANGNTGKAVAQHLLKRADRDHYVVKVGARSEDKVADLVKLGAHYVKVDFSDAESLHAAVKGVDRVWATAPNPTKQQKENDRIHLVNNLIDAAKEANVKYFLFGSVLGAQYEAVTFAREFRIAEKKLEASGIAYTHLRMAAFQENYLGQKDNIAKGFIAEPLGNGAYCPLSVEDVGIAATELLLNPHPHLNKAYDLTGPKALSGTQLAHRLSKVVGHKVNFISADPEQTYQFLAQFMAEYQAKGMLELYNLFSNNIAKTPSTDFTLITGRTGTRFYNRMKQLKAWGAL